MIRSALIALDGSAASKVAVDVAIRFVQTQSRPGPEGTIATRLTGIAVLDRLTITKRQATPVGGGGFKKERDEELLAQADAATQEILAEFAATCQAEDIEHEIVRAEGLPYEAIAAASQTHDLVVIGRETNFQFQTSDDPCETFRRLLRDHPCPVIITPQTLIEGDGLVVAYDGSRASSRALHTFALMEPRVEHLNVHVVSVDRSQEQAELNCLEAAELLRRHGVSVSTHPMESSSNPTEILIEKSTSLKARLVIMGAFGRQGLRTVFFGSTTRRMLDQCPFPVFVY